MQNTYSRSKLVDYIVDALGSGIDASKLANEVAAYLIDSGKVNELDSVMRDAKDLRARKSGIVEVDIKTAHDINDATVKQIEMIARQQYPQSKKVTLNKIHDESVVAGASLSLPHSSFDVTVRAKLNRLKEAIS